MGSKEQKHLVIQSSSNRSGVIAIMVDERLSRERGAILTRIINSLRQFTKVELLGGSITEDQLIKKMETTNYDLVLLPWYRYLSWSRAEAFWGLTRTSGPTLAGYFCEQLLPYEIGEHAEHLRGIFLDFANLQTGEVHTIFKSLYKDVHRSGIKPLIDPDAKIYVEHWYGNQGLGTRIDSVLGLSEFQDPAWAKRTSAMRICLSALWSLIYEDGPGKTEFNQLTTANVPKAYFQIAADREVAVFRLGYSLPNSSSKDAIAVFWPNPKLPAAPAQLLLKYADFVRVHSVAGTNDIEVVVGFFPSAVAEQAHGQVHTLWVEPIAANLFTEPFFEAPGPNSPRLRPLPHGSAYVKDPRDNNIRAVNSPGSAANQNSGPILRPSTGAANQNSGLVPRPVTTTTAATEEQPTAKIIELLSIIQKREATIQELKSGGVSTAQPLAPPDPESLPEAFQERYFDAKYQIRQLELEIVALEKRNATPEEINNLKQKMAALANREASWIRKLASTIETFRAAGGKK
jgi:hypothetical protein